MHVALMVEGQEDVSWPQWLDLANACEAAGVPALFRSDHYGGVMGEHLLGSHDAWSTLAALGASTTRLRLGTLVSPATFRHPSILARAVVTADHASGGRVELGIGAGWNEREHRAFGFAFPETRTRFDVLEEQLEIITRQWGPEPFNFDGRHYQLSGCDANPKPVQRPRPPLLMGGGAGPRAARLAARYADEYNVVYQSVDACRDLHAGIDRACEAAGRDPASMAFSLMIAVVAGADADDLAARGERLAAARSLGSGEAALREVAEGGGLVGTVDELTATLEAYAAVGVDRVMAQIQDHSDVEMVSLLGALERRFSS